MSTGPHIIPGVTHTCDRDDLKQCDGLTNKSCFLYKGLILANQIIGKIDTEQRCKNECKILGTSGGICKNNNRCLCLNPNVITNLIPSKNKCSDTSKTYSTLKCSNGECALKEDNQNYFEYPNIINPDNKTNIYCGCDKDILELYKANFHGDDPTNLSKLWKQATDNYTDGKCDNLNIEFNKILLDTIPNKDGNIDEEKLQILTAYEMCRLTNKFNPRNVENTSNQSSEEKWQDLLKGDSKTSKWLHFGFKLLVYTMLTHTLFRMFIPKNANMEGSLGNAMFLPKEFLQGDPNSRQMIIIFSIIFSGFMVGLEYSQGNNHQLWECIGSIIVICGIMFWIGHTTEWVIFKYLAISILVFSVPAIIANMSEKSGTNLNPGKITDKNATIQTMWGIAIGMCLLSVFASILILIVNWNNLTNGSFDIPISILIGSIIMMIILRTLVPNNQDSGNTLFNWYIPNSFQISDILKSGFFISLYAVVIGALLSKYNASSFTLFLGTLIVMGVSAIFQGIWNDNVDEDDKIIDVKDKKITGILVYYIFLAIIAVLYGVLAFIKYKEWSNPFDNYEYAIPFLISTMFGILPLAVFLIIINYSIASFAPSMALFFLVLYRVSGFLVAGKPDSGFGKVILAITGKRKTDVWVMPFLPWITYIIKAYYKIKGDQLPTYFDDTGIATGVTDTNMWIS